MYVCSLSVVRRTCWIPTFDALALYQGRNRRYVLRELKHFLFLSATRDEEKKNYFQNIDFFFCAKRLLSAGLSQGALSKTTIFLENK